MLLVAFTVTSVVTVATRLGMDVEDTRRVAVAVIVGVRVADGVKVRVGVNVADGV